MSSLNGLVKTNIKIYLGVAFLIIAIICISDKLLNNLDIRLIDWLGWIGMFTAGVTSIIEGISIEK